MDTASNRAVSSRGIIRAEEHATADAQRETVECIEVIAVMVMYPLPVLLESWVYCIPHRDICQRGKYHRNKNDFSIFLYAIYKGFFLLKRVSLFSLLGGKSSQNVL